MLDHPFGEWWNQNGANTASGEEQGERKSSVACEPGKDRASVRELCGGVCNQPEHKKCQVELNDMRRQPAKRGQCDGKNQNSGEDDTARGKAIEQKADEGRDKCDRNGSQRKRSAHRFTLPTKG